MENRRIRSRGLEVNTMAILDGSGFNKGSQDSREDRITFLEAVRAASLGPDNGIAPTAKMFEAIFQILKDENSLELIMAGYKLLNELEKRFPRAYTSQAEISSNVPELVVVEEAWSPFMFGADSERDNAFKYAGGSLDSSGFHILIQDLSKVAVETKFEELETKTLRNMLLLQYLVSVLEGDYVPRNSICKENMNWNLLRESLLNILLGSRRISYKVLIKDCVAILCEMSEINHDMKLPENSASELVKYRDAALAICFPEVKKCTCIALQKLLVMGMEMDISKKKADMLGLTNRADGLRTPVVEIVQDEFTYNRDALPLFLQVFTEPEWKLEIIVQYFQKYIAKPSVRTRRESDPINDATFDGILKSFSNSNTAKNITKKISTEVAQLLLAHAFQAYQSLCQFSAEDICCPKEDVRGSSLVEICRNIVSAFTTIGTMEKHAEILPFGKEALFTAATILSTKS